MEEPELVDPNSMDSARENVFKGSLKVPTEIFLLSIECNNHFSHLDLHFGCLVLLILKYKMKLLKFVD